VQVTFGDHTERTDRGQYPGLGAVNVVDAIPVQYALPFAPRRHVELAREGVETVTVSARGRITSGTTPTAEVTAFVTGIVTPIVARVVSVERDAAPSMAEPGACKIEASRSSMGIS
jgi:hypothetical protein